MSYRHVWPSSARPGAARSGDLPLETSLKMYEVGTHLATHCAKTLEKAELQVQRWQEGGNTARFDGWQGDESG
ncbi:MAG: exodeoxyribonuclease VII small subunit [Caldilineaceae bacterium]